MGLISIQCVYPGFSIEVIRMLDVDQFKIFVDKCRNAIPKNGENDG